MRLVNILILIILIFSCNKDSNVDVKNYLNNIEDLKWQEGKGVIIILSNNHCEYCVDKTVKFKEKYNEIENLHVIFSVSNKEKSMLDIYGVNLSNNKNYISDNYKAYKKNIIKDKPLVLFISDGSINKSIELIPDNLESTYSLILDFFKDN